MNGDEVRRIAREKIVKALVGDDFRPDKPTEIGGLIGEIVGAFGVPSYEVYRQKIGAIAAMKVALEIVNASYREANGLEPQEEN